MTGPRPRGGLGRGLGALIPSGPPPATPPATTAAAEPEQPDAGAPAGGAPSADATAPGTAGSGATAGGADPDTADTALRGVPGARMADIPVAAIRANAHQPRTVFDDDALDELAHSIREFGVLQPVVVRPTPGGDTPYELVMGERRLRAAAAAGLATVPAVVRDTADDAMLRDALLENIHRAALNPLEEAAAYQQLLEEFGATHDELATRIGRSRSQVSNTIRLMNLPLPVQRRVAAGVLSAGHARAVLGLATAAEQEDLAARIVAEGLSVRATEEIVALAQSGGGATTSRRRTRSFTAPALGGLADRLSDTFDTRVRVDLGRRKGRIVVEFASVDDLERIVAMMAPDLAGQRLVDAASSGDTDDGSAQPEDAGPEGAGLEDGEPEDGGAGSGPGA